VSTAKHIAIIGAGPIGLEAALYAVQRGYRVTVFEWGTGIAHNLWRWGHVRLFTPFGMNTSAWGRSALLAAGVTLPSNDALLPGRDFVLQYLAPLAALPPLHGCIQFETEVVRIGRSRSLKTEHIGERARGEESFRLLVRNNSGQRTIDAGIVFDCSGTYGNHNWIGSGGIPCPGEIDLARHIIYELPAFPSPELVSVLYPDGRSTEVLVVGSGYSAATTVLRLATPTSSIPGHPGIARLHWVTRGCGSEPIRRIEQDSLPERDRIAVEANKVATSGGSCVEWLPNYTIECLRRSETDPIQWEVVVSAPDSASSRTIKIDCLIANVGYRPDRSLYEELQVHECYATQGPIKLAAKLLGETSADCLDQASHGPESLRNPEPNFFILGAKSYGRNSNFLMQVGLQQIVDVFKLIDGSSSS